MVSKYGIVEVEQQGDLFLVKNLVEKPEKEKVNPGYNGEIQLTDALKLLLDKQKIYAKKIEGKGGGKADIAQGGGDKPENLEEALKYLQFLRR